MLNGAGSLKGISAFLFAGKNPKIIQILRNIFKFTDALS